MLLICSKKKVLTDISSYISWEKLYVGGKMPNGLPMLLLLNISEDSNSELREQENKENQILKHKSEENLYTEIFHDHIIFYQCLLRNIVQIE